MDYVTLKWKDRNPSETGKARRRLGRRARRLTVDLLFVDQALYRAYENEMSPIHGISTETRLG